MNHEPVPQRLSDAERDSAAAMLREHYEAGRLNPAEFDERLSTTMGARVATDLAPVFADLPEPRPGSRPTPMRPSLPVQHHEPPVPATTSGTDWIGVGKGVVWPAAIIMAILTGNWGVFLALGIVASIMLGQISNNQRKPPPYLDE